MKRLLKNILSLIVLVVVTFMIWEVLKLDVLPNKYLYLLIGGEALVFILGVILYNLKNKILMVLGILIFIIMIGANIFGYYSLKNINHYVSTSFKKDYYSTYVSYYVVTGKNNPVENVKELTKDSVILYYMYGRSIDKAKEFFKGCQFQPSDAVISAMNDVYYNYKYFLIAKSNYDYYFDSSNGKDIDPNNFKVIYEFEVEERTPINKETPTSYNIYVNGLDFTGIMRDYSLIVSVNTETREIVLTSIPRDYYVYVPAYNLNDTLMCLGALDSEVSKEALEKLFNIKIDYVVNVNTTSLVDIVDSLGGIEFCSDYDFWTTHALVMNTYDDTQGQKLHVTRGCRQYNGIETLTIARERIALPGGDRYRQKNCRQILMTIIKKIAATTTLSNYPEVIKSFEGVYTTDMNEKTVKQLVKTFLEDTNFKVYEQSVDGTAGYNKGHLGFMYVYVMNPDMSTVEAATNQINTILNNKNGEA